MSSALPTYPDFATFLPRKPIQEFARKHTIYGPGQPTRPAGLVNKQENNREQFIATVGLNLRKAGPISGPYQAVEQERDHWTCSE